MPWSSYRGKDLPKLFGKILPYASLLACALFVVVAVGIGNPDLAIKGLYLLVPVALAAVIVILKPSLVREDYGHLHSKYLRSKLGVKHRYFTHLVLLFALLFLITLYLLIAHDTRPLAYFALVAAMAGLILMQIVLVEPEQSGRKAIILTQIIVLSLNLTMGQTLKLPLFFGHTDVFGHMYNIESIGEEAHITSAMGDYQYFPLFHVFHHIGMSITGLELETSFFLVGGLSFAVSILVLYVLVGQLTRNAQLPLIAALMYAIGGEAIFGGMYMITRTMAFILCLLALYLLVRGRRHLKIRALAILAMALIVPLTLTHHTTLLQFTFILLLFVMIELVLYRRSRHIGYVYPMLFTCAYLMYWIYVAGFFDFALSTIISTTEGAPVGIPTEGSGQSIPVTLIRNVDSAIIAFFAVIGIVSVLLQRREVRGPAHTFILFSLIAFVLSVGDISAFTAHETYTYRLTLLLSPFAALAAATGIVVFVRRLNTSKNRTGAWAMGISALALVILFSFFSVIVVGTRTDVDNSLLTGNLNRQYFTQAELDSLSFISERGSSPVYSDYATDRYLDNYVRAPVVHSTAEVSNIESIEEGYFLFREGEYRSRGQLDFFVNEYSEEGDTVEFRVVTYTLGENEYPGVTWDQEARVFDNGPVQIYQK